MSFSKESLQDHLDFMIEQIELAKEFPSHREAAIDAASSSIPYIRSRIVDENFNPGCSAAFALSIEFRRWADIAKLTHEDFMKTADDLIGHIRRLKKFVSLPGDGRA
jgi:hypothetical protein